MQNLIIRTMKRPDLNFMIDQAANEGWNPGLHDAETFYKTDPNGFFLAEINGKPVGCISQVKYDDTFAFLGFFIVLPEYRGKGIGFQLWQHAVKYAAGCNIGLDGVVAQQENYQKSGFKFAYNNSRYEYTKQTDFDTSKDVIPLNQVEFEKILNFDRQCFPTNRITFLQNWIKQTGSNAYAIQHNQDLAGFITIRPCRSGYKIGPLFADSFYSADKLFQAVISCIPMNEKVYLDIPEINFEAVRLVQKYKMQKVFETARMYTGNFPDIDVNKIFGVTTFELG